MRKKLKPNRVGVMTLLDVYEGGMGPLANGIIGRGWVMYCSHYDYRPTIISLDGKELPAGPYTLHGTDQKLVLITENIH